MRCGPINTGTSVTDRPAAAAIIGLGEGQRREQPPSCASSVNTGRKDSVMTSSRKTAPAPLRPGLGHQRPALARRQAGDHVGSRHCSRVFVLPPPPSPRSRPPAPARWRCRQAEDVGVHALPVHDDEGREHAHGQRDGSHQAERRWNRNTAQTRATTMNSSMSLLPQVVDGRSMSLERS